MPRGRPKGSKNKASTLVSSIVEVGREYAVREVASNGIVWVSPAFPPFLTKEEAESQAKRLLDNKTVPIAEVVNQKERLALRNGGGSITPAIETESEEEDAT